MKLDKAIERLGTFVERHPGAGYSDLIPAIELGIEALRRVKRTRDKRFPVLGEELPSETKD